jgi:hypothetical protein
MLRSTMKRQYEKTRPRDNRAETNTREGADIIEARLAGLARLLARQAVRAQLIKDQSEQVTPLIPNINPIEDGESHD